MLNHPSKIVSTTSSTHDGIDEMTIRLDWSKRFLDRLNAFTEAELEHYEHMERDCERNLKMRQLRRLTRIDLALPPLLRAPTPKRDSVYSQVNEHVREDDEPNKSKAFERCKYFESLQRSCSFLSTLLTVAVVVQVIREHFQDDEDDNQDHDRDDDADDEDPDDEDHEEDQEEDNEEDEKEDDEGDDEEADEEDAEASGSGSGEQGSDIEPSLTCNPSILQTVMLLRSTSRELVSPSSTPLSRPPLRIPLEVRGRQRRDSQLRRAFKLIWKG